MRKKIFIFLLLLNNFIYAKNDNLELWYEQPAKDWNSALPIGNGHLGAMIMGNPNNEIIYLNDNTLYSGEPDSKYTKVNIKNGYNSIVENLYNGNYQIASDSVQKYFAGRLHENYQPLCNLHIINNKQTKRISNYKRSLNIENAISYVEYESDGYMYKREYFASHPSDFIIIKLSTNNPQGLDISLFFKSKHPTVKYSINKKNIKIKGQAPGYAQRRTFQQIEAWNHQNRHPELYNPDGTRKHDSTILYGNDIKNRGMFFEALLYVTGNDIKVEKENDKLNVKSKNDIILLFTASTSYNGFKKSPSLEGKKTSIIIENNFKRIANKNFEDLKNEHITDYQSLFKRFSIILSNGNQSSEKDPTDKRILRFKDKNDLGLISLLTQYGRYLMICGSRKGGQPLNLQGIWNKDIIPAWNGGYTTNINAEMNYWPAEVANLSECHYPFIEFIKECYITGKECATKMYNKRGWVGHHNSSIWRETYPNDGDPGVFSWNMMAPWLCTHLWEHFNFTQDTTFAIKEAYPIMKSAAQFCIDWLIEDKNGYLVTPISVSPENKFIDPKTLKPVGISMGSTMDMTLIRELFSQTYKLAKIAQIDKEFRDTLINYKNRLLPFKIGAYGRLQEWNIDFEDYDKHHRHISHLIGLFPLNQITPKTPELFSAAKQSLEIRGDKATGWSIGWKINLWARLLDGERAYQIIKNFIRPVGFGPSELQSTEGGIYSNLFDAHPPFQIDGNLGFTAGICEMIVQSQNDELLLLPAIPIEWEKGEVKGIVARGGYIINLSWNKGRIINLEIKSRIGKIGKKKIISKYPLPNGYFSGNILEFMKTSDKPH